MENITEIQDLEKMLLEAIKENNISVLDQLLHNDLLFVTPTGQVINKEADIDNYISGNVMIDLIKATEQRIHVIENTAVVTTKIELKGKYLEYILDDSFQYIRVWIKQENNWKIIGGSGIKL